MNVRFTAQFGFKDKREPWFGTSVLLAPPEKGGDENPYSSSLPHLCACMRNGSGGRAAQGWDQLIVNSG